MSAEYVGSQQEKIDHRMSQWWSDDPGLGPYEVRCPECSEATPDVLMCGHDEHATGTLCPNCCENAHPHQCRRCLGHGRFSDHTLPHHAALGRYRDCTICGGRGRVNEEKSA